MDFYDELDVAIIISVRFAINQTFDKGSAYARIKTFNNPTRVR
jgi:hypothetical protein